MTGKEIEDTDHAMRNLLVHCRDNLSLPVDQIIVQSLDEFFNVIAAAYGQQQALNAFRHFANVKVIDASRSNAQPGMREG